MCVCVLLETNDFERLPYFDTFDTPIAFQPFCLGRSANTISSVYLRILTVCHTPKDGELGHGAHIAAAMSAVVAIAGVVMF